MLVKIIDFTIFVVACWFITDDKLPRWIRFFSTLGALSTLGLMIIRYARALP